MKKNMGSTDRIIRIAAAFIIGILYFSGRISGAFAIAGLVLSGIFLLTGFTGVCPLYTLFGISTCRRKKVSA